MRVINGFKYLYLFLSCCFLISTPSCEKNNTSVIDNEIPIQIIGVSDTTVGINDSIYLSVTISGKDAGLKFLWQKSTSNRIDTLTVPTYRVAFKDTGKTFVTVSLLNSRGELSTPDTIHVTVFDKIYSMYSIGNSHTMDFEPTKGFLNIVKTEQISITNGYHINCSSPLNNSWLNPEKTCVEPNSYGRYLSALSSSHLNILTIQPYSGTQGFLEKKAVIDFIDYALKYQNKDSLSLFIYCTWPNNSSNPLDSFDYSKSWLKSYQNGNNPIVLSRSFYKYLVDSVLIAYPTLKIGMISVGEVLYRFHESAKNGLIPGFTGAGQLYRDAGHLNNVGRYIASLTVFSVVFNKNPLSISDFQGFDKSASMLTDRDITPEQKNVFRTIISQTLDTMNK